MAVYKIIQDIEAEDKLVGPFGIRQFVYLLIVAGSLFLAFQIAQLAWWLAIPLVPHTLFFALLAAPIGGGQPTEVWLLAKFRFAIKPRKHVWEQSGFRQLVTITVPKQVEKHLTKELSQFEVKSRLQALASTLDSHGWSSKHLSTDPFATAAMATAGPDDSYSDRLVGVGPLVQQSDTSGLQASDDILDEQHNPTAQKLGQMIDESSKVRREQILAKMKQPATQTPQAVSPSAQTTPPAGTPPSVPPPVFPAPTKPTGSRIVQPDPSAVAKQNDTPAPETEKSKPLTEQELLEKIHSEQEKPKNYGHMRVVHPLGQQPAPTNQSTKTPQQDAPEPLDTIGTRQAPPMTQTPDPDIIELANNDDLNVETIARQANKKKAAKGEVVINLHDNE